MNNNTSLGEKIKTFRKRAKLSQLDLELKIEASPGSISRIENGEVNPTKETLIKIIEVLDLRAYDAASLFNLDFDELSKMVKLARKIGVSLDLNKTLQNVVNEIAYELNLHGVSIFLVKGSELYAETFTNTWYGHLVMELISRPFNSLSVSLENEDNYIVRSIKTKKTIQDNNLSNFTIGAIPLQVSRLLQKVTDTKSLLVFPIISENDAIGAVLFSKNYIDDFKNEYNILSEFVNYIAITISNAKKYSNLQEEIINLKNAK